MPNLFSCEPVEMYSWVCGSTSGLSRQGDRRAHTFPGSDLVDVVQLRFALDVETVNALLERVLDFLTRFPDTGEGALARIAPCREHAKEFATGNNVETRARVA